ncbi:MAG: outer rane efflux protein [Edaphobacter sp.]|nr:outer rane efflux protein [Edaphobacter sp.]
MAFSLKLLASILTASSAFAQSTAIRGEIYIEPPKKTILGPLIRPYQHRFIAPVNVNNTPRLESLVRSGNLYLTVDDVIALALENNVDIAIQRYGPFLSREVLRRAEGGGFLRNVGTPVQSGPVSVSLAGVSVNTNGLATGSSGIGSGGGIVIQLGPTPPLLDPQFFAYANFQHSTSPLSNTILSQTTALTNNTRTFQTGITQSFLTGTSAQATFYTSRSLVNSPANLLNPATTAYIDLYITQNLLQGFGRAVNGRNIVVAKNNMKVTDLQLKLQVITTISSVLNLYWDLVSFHEDVRIKQQALGTAQKLFEDNKKQVEIGSLSRIEITRAEAEVSAREEELLIALTNVAQQETILKNTLSRTGAASATLDEVHIVPLDRIQVPQKETLKPVNELIPEALAARPEVEQTKINIESSLANLTGTRNSLKPVLQAFADFTNHALSGGPNPLYNGASGAPDPYFVGGYSNVATQLFRRNFPDYSAGFALNIPFRNRAAQADYVIDQLTLRQSELQLQRTVNQVRLDVKNAVIGLQQARVRYEAAVRTRVLAEQTLDAEQKKFQFSLSPDLTGVVQAQRDLALDQSAEVQALANYTHAKVAFQQALGTTLEDNHISLQEAATGRVAHVSVLPENPK